MKKGDRIIWDSHFGYEIGHFIEDCGSNHYNHVMVELKTGIVTEPTNRPKNEIQLYSDELVNKLKIKYGYEKKFSEVF